MATKERLEKAYEFFRLHAEDGTSFSIDEFCAATDYKESSFETNRSKHWNSFLARHPVGGYCVKREFLRGSKTAFIRHNSQIRQTLPVYERLKHGQVITYEFLLPLTLEDRLRRALDELFYRDTVERRLREVGLHNVERVVSRYEGEDDDHYMRRLLDRVGVMLSGYSISHVSGRFRASELQTRTEAGAMLVNEEPYLIDETTAVVRFMMPCLTTRVKFDAEPVAVIDVLQRDDRFEAEAFAAEVREIRALFFLIFVEAIVQSVQDQAEIWLLEGGVAERLYIWRRVREEQQEDQQLALAIPSTS